MRKEVRQEIEARLYNPLSEEWEKVINLQVEQLSKPQQRLYTLRYKKRQTERQICDALHIERATYYNWVSTLIHDVALQAAYHNLIKP